jgi:Protein kinase domain
MSQQQQHHHYQQHQSEGGRSVESAPSSFGIEQRMAQLLVSTQQNPIPIQQQQQQQQQQHRPKQLITPLVTGQRPYDELGKPPQNPRPFERPQYGKGRRCEVLCYNPLDDSHSQLKNVLLRDPPISGDLGGRVEENSTNRSNNRLFPGSVGSPNQSTNKNNNTMCAYYPSPFKEPIKTIMGHVEICNVLERIQRQRDDDFDDDDESDSSIDDEDDIVFQWTDRLVAVKVNSLATMERLRGKHAEDPFKEIAAMQLIGTTHPHVLGCIDALYDGKNLNVVMPYCDSGDLFQLLQDTQEYNAKLDDPNSPPGLSEGQSRYWFRQLMSGVQHMHSEAGVCHRYVY